MKISELYALTVEGEFRVGEQVVPFPISMGRGATEDGEKTLQELAKRRIEISDRVAVAYRDTEVQIERASSIATPDTDAVTGFISQVNENIAAVVPLLVNTSDGRGFKAKPSEAAAKVHEVLSLLPTWAVPLFTTPEQVEEAAKRATDAAENFRVVNAEGTRQLHRLKAERVAFWCHTWELEGDDGQPVKVTPEILEKMPPAWLDDLEEEIEKKAPARSLLL